MDDEWKCESCEECFERRDLRREPLGPWLCERCFSDAVADAEEDRDRQYWYENGRF